MLLVLDFKPPIHPPLVGVLDPTHTREVVTFLPFLLVGLIPPFSPFFMAALEEFDLHMVHLTPTPSSR